MSDESARAEHASQEFGPRRGPTGGQRTQGRDDVPLAQCPACGELSIQPVFDGGQWNYLCLHCGTCSHVRDGEVETVDPLTCPGCRLRDFCPASPSPLARSLMHRAVLRNGLPVTIRPLVHSDLLSFCGLAARARAEAERDAATDLLARIFCDVSDIDTDRFTWVALTRDGRALPIALATLCRCEEDGTCARLGLGVESAYRGQGLGELLYQKLAETAASYRIESFRSTVSLRSAEDLNELASLGIDVRPLGSRSAELHWPLESRTSRMSHFLRLLGLLEFTVADPPGDPNAFTGAHWSS